MAEPAALFGAMPVLDLRGNGHHIAGLQAPVRLALLLIPALAVYADQQLTAAGQVIYRYAQRFFVESEHAILEAEQAEARQNATLFIGSSLLNPCKPFVDLWYQINQSFPDYTLQIVPFEDDHKGILSEISALGTKFDLLAGVCDSASGWIVASFSRWAAISTALPYPESIRCRRISFPVKISIPYKYCGEESAHTDSSPQFS